MVPLTLSSDYPKVTSKRLQIKQSRQVNNMRVIVLLYDFMPQNLILWVVNRFIIFKVAFLSFLKCYRFIICL